MSDSSDNTIREQAIEAASHELYESETGLDWYADANPVDTHYSRKRVTPLVDAVLAVAGPALRAEGMREIAEEVLHDDGNGLHLRGYYDALARAKAEEADHA